MKPAQKLFFHQSEFLALTKKLVMSALKRERVSSNQVDTSSLSRHTSCFKHQKLIAAQDSVGWKTVQLTHLRLYFSSLVTVVLDFLALVHPDCLPYRTSNSWLSVTELEKKSTFTFIETQASCISLFKSLGARYFPAFVFRYLYLLCLVFPMPVAHPFNLYLWYYWVWISLIDTYQKRRRCNIRAVL